jgi:hypothetical protein
MTKSRTKSKAVKAGSEEQSKKQPKPRRQTKKKERCSSESKSKQSISISEKEQIEAVMNDEDFGIEVPVALNLNTSADFIVSKKKETDKLSALSRSEGQYDEDLLDCLHEMLPDDGHGQEQDYSEFNEANCCIAGGESLSQQELRDLVESKHKVSYNVDQAIDQALGNF